MSERTEVSFDAALMMALRADAQKELDELPSPAQLKERYPDTSRWDARLQAALHKRRPVLKRVLIAVLTLVILTLGALAVSAEFRRAVYTMIQKFLPIEMQLTYQMDGEPLEQLPNGYSDHYVPDGFERDYEQGYDNEISFLHAYVDANDKSIFYYVDCSVIQDYGQIETFDNEHVYNTYKRLVYHTAYKIMGDSYLAEDPRKLQHSEAEQRRSPRRSGSESPEIPAQTENEGSSVPHGIARGYPMWPWAPEPD